MAFQKQTLRVFLFFGSYLLVDPAGIWQSAGLLLTNVKSCFSGSHKSGGAGSSGCVVTLPGRLGAQREVRVSGLQGLQLLVLSDKDGVHLVTPAPWYMFNVLYS